MPKSFPQFACLRSVRPCHSALVALALAAISVSLPLAAQSSSASNTIPAEPTALHLQPAELDLTAVARAEDGRGFSPTSRLDPQQDLLPAASAPETSSSSLPFFGPQQTTKPTQPATPPSTDPADAPDKPSKRILGLVPNYRAVGVGAHLPPQSPKQKFITATQDNFDYSAFALAFIVSGYNDLRNATPEFKSGGSTGVTYGRYLWHTYLDQTTENYSVEFIVPALTHEDTRFYTLGVGGTKKRILYALSRLVITRSDSGKETANLSELLGAAMSSGLSNLYYPRAERTIGNSLTQYGTNLGIDAVSYVVREFDSDITHVLSPKHKKPTADATK